jgi:anti-sigma-K factor RskA
MSGRVLQFESGVHKVVDALLPWYVNGTLEGAELEYVQRHLVECPQCLKEAEWLRELYAACAAAESMPGASGALRKLRRALEAAPPTKSGFSARVRGGWRSSNAWTRGSVAASLALVVILAASVLRDTDAPALYRTLGAGSMASHASGSLIVVFDPATAEADLRRILRTAGARLVDGPTQSNAYVLDVPAGGRQDAMRVLRSERAVVLVERLGPEDGQ